MKNIVVYDEDNKWFDYKEYQALPELIDQEWIFIPKEKINDANKHYMKSFNNNILVVVFDRITTQVENLFESFKQYNSNEEYDYIIWMMFGTAPMLSMFIRNPQMYSFLLINGFHNFPKLTIDNLTMLSFYIVSKGLPFFNKKDEDKLLSSDKFINTQDLDLGN